MSSSTSWKRLLRSFINWLHEKTREPDKSPRSTDIRYRENHIGSRVRLGTSILKGNCRIQDEVVLKGKVSVGKYTTIGKETIIHGGEIEIGSYCQLAPRVAIYAVNHPTEHLTTYVNENLLNGSLRELATERPVVIHNDVWIGYGAIVLPGVSIGNGAVIGAGSVVTKDVDPYGVAVGNPAKIAKHRFEKDLIELLLKWEWWNLDPSELTQFRSVFFYNIQKDPEAFKAQILDILSNKRNKG